MDLKFNTENGFVMTNMVDEFLSEIKLLRLQDFIECNLKDLYEYGPACGNEECETYQEQIAYYSAKREELERLYRKHGDIALMKFGSDRWYGLSHVKDFKTLKREFMYGDLKRVVMIEIIRD